MQYPLLGILGGTFDPIHNGHLEIATHVDHALACQHIVFIPCKQPVLKAAAHATAQQRLAMLEIALRPYPSFMLDRREVDRDSPSFMVETLVSLRADYPQHSLCVILGTDAFHDLPLWHKWQTLLDLCHCIVINRSVSERAFSATLTAMIAEAKTAHKAALSATPHGHIYFLEIPTIPISSSAIRKAIAKGDAPSELLPPAVWDYIQEQQLYARSTMSQPFKKG